MNYLIIGKKNVDYFSKKKNKQVTGVELYLQSVDEIVGNGVGNSVLPPIYFNSDKHTFNDFDLGDIVEVYYNQFGKVSNVIKV